MAKQPVLGIVGNGPAMLAILVQLYVRRVKNLRVLVFSKARNVKGFHSAQQRRIWWLQAFGIDVEHLCGAGNNWHPVDPSNFTINGDHSFSAFSGLPFRDYTDWLRLPSVRFLVALIYPEWLTLYPDFWDDIKASSPRGLIGIWLHCQFLWVRWLLLARGITIQIVKIENGVESIYPLATAFKVQTSTADYLVDKLVLASGNVFQSYPDAIPCYPAEAWDQQVQHQKVTIFGGGPSAIEAALYALNLGAVKVELITRSGYLRLPDLTNRVDYTPIFFTEDRLREHPYAIYARLMLLQEWDYFCQVHKAHAMLDDFLALDDFVSFMQDVIQSIQQPGFRPELRFFAAIGGNVIRYLYGQREDIFPESEWEQVSALFAQYRYLFETISLETAHRLIIEVEQGRIGLYRLADDTDILRINATGIINILPAYLEPLKHKGYLETFSAAKSGMRIHHPFIAYAGGLSLRSAERASKAAITKLFP